MENSLEVQLLVLVSRKHELKEIKSFTLTSKVSNVWVQSKNDGVSMHNLHHLCMLRAILKSETRIRVCQLDYHHKCCSIFYNIMHSHCGQPSCQLLRYIACYKVTLYHHFWKHNYMEVLTLYCDVQYCNIDNIVENTKQL